MKPLYKQYLFLEHFTLDIRSVNYVYFRWYFYFVLYYAMLFYVLHSCIAFLHFVEA